MFWHWPLNENKMINAHFALIVNDVLNDLRINFENKLTINEF